MFNLNIPTKDEVKANVEDAVVEHEAELVIAGGVIATIAGLLAGYWLSEKAVEHGVAKGMVKGYRLIR